MKKIFKIIKDVFMKFGENQIMKGIAIGLVTISLGAAIGVPLGKGVSNALNKILPPLPQVESSDAFAEEDSSFVESSVEESSIEESSVEESSAAESVSEEQSHSSEEISSEETSSEEISSEEISSEETSSDQEISSEDIQSSEEDGIIEESSSAEIENSEVDSSQEEDSSQENTSEEVEGSKGLKYALSDDGEYYIVTGIGNCKDMDVEIPVTYSGLPVCEIAEWAFSKSVITSITLPDSIERIGYAAFNDCTNLKKVHIGNGIRSVGEFAFFNCEKIQYTIKEQMRYLGNPSNPYLVLVDLVEAKYTKYDISKITKVIADCAFMNSIVKEIVIPDSVTDIGAKAFMACQKLEKVEIGAGVKRIGVKAFQNCNSLNIIAFVTKEGWKAGGEEIFSGDLTNYATAARYLKNEDKYRDVEWMRKD